MGDIVGLEAYHTGQVETIEGVEVIDDHTLQVRIESPVSYFLAKLTYPVAWVVDRYNVVLPNWQLHPNGTGPFRHLQHLEEEIFILERNPWYYNEPPRIDYVVYLMYAGYTQRLYETGEVDYAGLTRDQLDRASDPGDGLFGSIFSETSLCTYYVTFNTKLPPFDDLNVRRAFVLAVDRERYVEAITNNEAVVGRGLLPPGMPGYSDEIVLPNYDPEGARELLAASPYYDGSQDPPPITWTLPTSGGYYSPAAAFLVDTWEEVLGVTILVEGIDWESYNDQIDAGLYGQLLNEGWCADYPDPENFLDVLFHSGSAQNHAYYQNMAFDALIATARAEPDIERRLETYREAEQLLVDDAPLLILHHSAPSYGVWKPYVKGYIPSPIAVPQHASMWIER
jgi:ABC-type transport system substrate-binding protein